MRKQENLHYNSNYKRSVTLVTQPVFEPAWRWHDLSMAHEGGVQSMRNQAMNLR